MEILTDVMGALLEMGRSYSFVFIASKAICIIIVVIPQVYSSFRIERIGRSSSFQKGESILFYFVRYFFEFVIMI